MKRKTIQNHIEEKIQELEWNPHDRKIRKGFFYKGAIIGVKDQREAAVMNRRLVQRSKACAIAELGAFESRLSREIG